MSANEWEQEQERERERARAMPGAPLDFSIVIPARDEEAFVQGALISVRDCAWPLNRLEVVVVDNGSRDRTSDVVRAFQQREPALALTLLREPEPGVARAKNRGAAAARGETLLFLDADSRIAPNLPAAIAAEIRRGYPAGCIRIRSDGGDWIDRNFFRLMELGKRLFGVRAQMLYCRRALFLQAGGFDESLKLAEDRELLTRLRRQVAVGYVTAGWIATSPRRLHRYPFHLGVPLMFGRWFLAHFGIGRDWGY